jgi:hypothetical protein
LIDNPILMPHRSVRRPRRRRFVALLLLLFACIALGGRTSISYYVDSIWFSSLGYRAVFWKALNLQWAVFAIFFGATFLFLYGWFRILSARAVPHSIPPELWCSGTAPSGFLSKECYAPAGWPELPSSRLVRPRA